MKAEQATFGGRGEKLGQPLLVDRHSPAAQQLDPLCVRLADPHPMPEAGETATGDEADVAGPDDCYVHRTLMVGGRRLGQEASAPTMTTASYPLSTVPNSTTPKPI